MRGNSKVTFSNEELKIIKKDLGVSTYLHCLCQSEVTIPQHWHKHQGQLAVKAAESNPGPAIVKVTGPTFDAICDIVRKTWNGKVGIGRDAANLHGYTSLKVNKVERIENPNLWRNYCSFRTDFCLKGSDSSVPSVSPPLQTGSLFTEDTPLDHSLIPEVNEVYLFHGIKPDTLKAITQQGLDCRCSSSNPLFGRGSYFAESSTKADQYAGMTIELESME